MTKGRKLRPRCRCFAPGRTPFEQWINNRRGFDISISRFVVDETAIVKQAIEAMSALRTLRCARPVHRPPFRKATDNGSAVGLPGSPSRPPSIQDNVLMHISETALALRNSVPHSGNSGVGYLRDRAFDL
jgi:hypothetical protein